MQELGSIIRRAREERGLSVDDLHSRTKIRHRFIEAIEEGRFEAIPGGAVYTKGFIRTLAEELGLDYFQLILMWEPPEAPPPVKPKRVGQYKPSVYPIIGAIIMILALVAAGVYYIYLRPQPQLPPPVVPPQVENPPVEEPVEPVDPVEPVEPTPAFVFVGEQNGRLVYDVQAWPMELIVRVNSESCWTLATVDGTRVETTLAAGQERLFTANNSMDLRLGKARVVDLIVNGESLGGQTGDVREYTFRKSGP